jgi:predicted RNA-binding protein YlqC (UPF0109 family)
VNVDENTTPDVHSHDDELEQDLPEEDLLDDEDDLYDDEYVDEAVAIASESGDEPVDQLRNLVSWVVDQLVDEPENVTVDAVQRGASVQVQVRLPEADLGKIIGRGGRIAKSMRTALMIVGSRHHMRVSLDIEGQE